MKLPICLWWFVGDSVTAANYTDTQLKKERWETSPLLSGYCRNVSNTFFECTTFLRFFLFLRWRMHIAHCDTCIYFARNLTGTYKMDGSLEDFKLRKFRVTLYVNCISHLSSFRYITCFRLTNFFKNITRGAYDSYNMREIFRQNAV